MASPTSSTSTRPHTRSGVQIEKLAQGVGASIGEIVLLTHPKLEDDGRPVGMELQSGVIILITSLELSDIVASVKRKLDTLSDNVLDKIQEVLNDHDDDEDLLEDDDGSHTYRITPGLVSSATLLFEVGTQAKVEAGFKLVKHIFSQSKFLESHGFKEWLYPCDIQILLGIHRITIQECDFVKILRDVTKIT